MDNNRHINEATMCNNGSDNDEQYEIMAAKIVLQRVIMMSK